MKSVRSVVASLLIGSSASLSAGSLVHGRASWYGEELRGSRMANGKPFDPDALTCASWDYPLGSIVKISYRGREALAVVTDRGPAKRFVRAGRIVDLSIATWNRLGANPTQGLIYVEIICLR